MPIRCSLGPAHGPTRFINRAPACGQPKVSVIHSDRPAILRKLGVLSVAQIRDDTMCMIPPRETMSIHSMFVFLTMSCRCHATPLRCVRRLCRNFGSSASGLAEGGSALPMCEDSAEWNCVLYSTERMNTPTCAAVCCCTCVSCCSCTTLPQTRSLPCCRRRSFLVLALGRGQTADIGGAHALATIDINGPAGRLWQQLACLRRWGRVQLRPKNRRPIDS